MDTGNRKFRYFRYPYLITGKSIEARTAFESYLKENRYIIAPVTLVTADWLFDKKYILAKQNNNSSKMEEIILDYLSFTTKKIDFCKKVSNMLFNRNIRHILLLHANQINADCLERILLNIKNMGYTFITLDRALEDPVYKISDQYYDGLGMASLYRRDFSDKKIIDWEKNQNVCNI